MSKILVVEKLRIEFSGGPMKWIFLKFSEACNVMLE